MDFSTINIEAPKAIGYYRSIAGVNQPVYGRRYQHLPQAISDQPYHQVQVAGWGGLYWINVDESDCVWY